VRSLKHIIKIDENLEKSLWSYILLKKTFVNVFEPRKHEEPRLYSAFGRGSLGSHSKILVAFGASNFLVRTSFPPPKSTGTVDSSFAAAGQGGFRHVFTAPKAHRTARPAWAIVVCRLPAEVVPVIQY
jgi:hypothetical protein